MRFHGQQRRLDPCLLGDLRLVLRQRAQIAQRCTPPLCNRRVQHVLLDRREELPDAVLLRDLGLILRVPCSERADRCARCLLHPRGLEMREHDIKHRLDAPRCPDLLLVPRMVPSQRLERAAPSLLHLCVLGECNHGLEHERDGMVAHPRLVLLRQLLPREVAQRLAAQPLHSRLLFVIQHRPQHRPDHAFRRQLRLVVSARPEVAQRGEAPTGEVDVAAVPRHGGNDGARAALVHHPVQVVAVGRQDAQGPTPCPLHAGMREVCLHRLDDGGDPPCFCHLDAVVAVHRCEVPECLARLVLDARVRDVGAHG
mmetsp:Transcript_6996/g.13885  ORF Transcript_6996/g.13885 Transcript_6996/m.13885 type:complete len:312 (-) Transcript_6996:2719-3654(-)